jgi:acetyl-CoA carboxylase carboxyltransferase component
MAILDTRVQRDSSTFSANRAAMLESVALLKKHLDRIKQGGGPEAADKHRSRGKLLVRDRIQALIDPGTEFLEFSALAAFEMYEGDAPGAGLVTGLGVVAGRECVIVANDATVKGGTYYPMTVKKHLRAQEIASENGLTCLYLVDSGGVEEISSFRDLHILDTSPRRRDAWRESQSESSG